MFVLQTGAKINGLWQLEIVDTSNQVSSVYLQVYSSSQLILHFRIGCLSERQQDIFEGHLIFLEEFLSDSLP